MEWIERGFKDEQLEKYQEIINMLGLYRTKMERPPWLGNHEYHRSHQANLVRKNPTLYGPEFPGVDPEEGYIWPVGKPRPSGWMDGAM